MDTSYYLPDPKEMTKEIFKTKLFRALFYIPGIKFYLSKSDEDFPNIPEEYIASGRQQKNAVEASIRENYIVCCTAHPNALYLCFCPATNDITSCWYLMQIGRLFSDNHFDDGDFSLYDTKLLAEYLLGPSWKTLLDDSTYNIQKNRFIHKYHPKKLLIESIECFSIVRYVLIAKLIEIEDDVTHIGTFGS